MAGVAEEAAPGSTAEPIPAPDVDPVEQLAHLVPALWRILKLVTRSGEDLPANESQVTIMRLVIHHDGLTPAQLADITHLARPTVSNLLKDLVRDGLVERITSERDARFVTIVPTDTGRSLLETFRRDRAAKLRDALGTLSPAGQDAVLSAVVPLRHVLRALETEADALAERVDAGSEQRA